MKRRHFITALGAAAVGGANGQVLKILGRKRYAPEAPNIIMMMADDMGMGDVNYYGWNDTVGQVLTPNLDDMAAKGLRLDRFYAQSPVCSPTRGSCISGRHAFRYGVWEANQGGGRVEDIMLPEVLKEQAGYRTGHFGKWHLGRMTEAKDWGKASKMDYFTPSMAGFDEWFSVCHSVKTFDPYGANGLDDPVSVDTDYNPYFYNGEEVTEPLFGDTSKLIVDRAKPFMEQAINAGKPFMTCLWFHTPHTDLDAHPDDRALFADDSENEQKYYGSIYAMDREIGKLREWLELKGIRDNTLLWFTCDNGHTSHGSAGPYLGAKRHLFEGGIRVPTILEWPEKITQPRTTDMLASTSDYFLTHLDAAGIAYSDPHPRDGISLMPLIEGSMTARPDSHPVCFQSHASSVIMNQSYKALKVRTGAYSDGKAEDYGLPLDEWMLFDMTLTDQSQIERTNIAADHAPLVDSMMATYDTWNSACENSFHGDDYEDPGDYPDQTYKGWAK